MRQCQRMADEHFHRTRSRGTQRVQSSLLPQPPPDMARPLGQPVFCWWARVGLPPQSWFAQEVRDRRSGRMRADAVIVPSVAGERYVVSMFGTISDWMHNIEAARGDAVTCHGSSLHVHLVLVPPEERAPILQEYVRVASSGRKHFPLLVGAPLADFAVIAPQYPVYRVEVPNLN